MSMRSRARRLQKASWMSYQQALAQIRAHAEEAAALARERGWPLGRADLELAGVHAPPAIEVVDATADEDPLRAACGRLLRECNALTVVLIGPGVQILIGARETRGAALAVILPRRSTEPTTTPLGDGVTLVAEPVDGGRATLGVTFDETSSLGLVRLRMRKAVAELSDLLAARRRPSGAMPPPVPNSAGPTGAPAEAWLSVVAIKRRGRS